MRILTFLILVLLSAVSAVADPLVIPFPTLTGEYPGDVAERTAVFAFGQDPAQINSVALKTAGSAVEGAVYCGTDEPMPWPMDSGATLFDTTTGGWWTAWVPQGVGKGDFDGTFVFTGSRANPPTWDFLADGEGELYFFGGPMSLIGICGPAASKPEATVTEVTLVFNLSSTAPTEPVTWSALKAIYR